MAHKKMKLGFVGQRGMVGSVLQGRISEVGVLNESIEHYFDLNYFSTSQSGQMALISGSKTKAEVKLKDAYNFDELREMQVIVTSQGGDYTSKVYSNLRDAGWKGYWIDAASTLRMDKEVVICLGPVNSNVIREKMAKGGRTFVGGNCTVSLLLMALGGPLKAGVIDWISTMTYQAASGSGARHMRELISQMGSLADNAGPEATDILSWEKSLTSHMRSSDFPTEQFSVPLAGGLIPWIDKPVEGGQSREEWKAQAEANKILQSQKIIPIDGTCVRIGALRCHAQAVTVKLNANIRLNEFEDMLKSSSSWTKLIPNEPEASMRDLNPAFVSGTLDIPVGRVRKMSLGPEYINLFTCGDQLLWGAAEPLRCMLDEIVQFEF